MKSLKREITSGDQLFLSLLLLLAVLVVPRFAYSQSKAMRQGAMESRPATVFRGGSELNGLRRDRPHGQISVPLSKPSSHHSGRFPHHKPLIFPHSFSDDTQISITVEQIQQSPPPSPEKAAQKKYYVPPRWVKTEHGVEVLEPGFWTDEPALARSKEGGNRERELAEY